MACEKARYDISDDTRMSSVGLVTSSVTENAQHGRRVIPFVTTDNKNNLTR